MANVVPKKSQHESVGFYSLSLVIIPISNQWITVVKHHNDYILYFLMNIPNYHVLQHSTIIESLEWFVIFVEQLLFWCFQHLQISSHGLRNIQQRDYWAPQVSAGIEILCISMSVRWSQIDHFAGGRSIFAHRFDLAHSEGSSKKHNLQLSCAKRDFSFKQLATEKHHWSNLRVYIYMLLLPSMLPRICKC